MTEKKKKIGKRSMENDFWSHPSHYFDAPFYICIHTLVISGIKVQEPFGLILWCDPLNPFPVHLIDICFDRLHVFVCVAMCAGVVARPHFKSHNIRMKGKCLQSIFSIRHCFATEKCISTTLFAQR